MLSPINYIWNIKILCIISSYKIRINFLNEVSPGFQKILLFLKTMDFGTNNWSTWFQSKNVPDKWLFLTEDLDNIGDLNNWITIWSWKFSFIGLTFDIETQYSYWGNWWLDMQWNRFNLSEILNINFKLACWLLLWLFSDFELSFLNLNPLHTDYIIIDHESESKWHIRLISDAWESIPILKIYGSFLK